MSFSLEVKEELAKRIGSSRHCQLAELAAIITSIGYVGDDKEGEMVLYLQSDNGLVLRKFFTLLKKAFNIVTSILEEIPDVKKIYDSGALFYIEDMVLLAKYGSGFNVEALYQLF